MPNLHSLALLLGGAAAAILLAWFAARHSRASANAEARASEMSRAGGWRARHPVLGAEMEDMKQRILDWVLLEPGRFSVEALARRLAWLPGVSQDPAFAAGSFRSCLARAMCRRLLLEARLAEADGTLWPPHGKPPVACRMQPRPAPWQLGAALKLPGEDPCRSLAAASRLERCLCRS